MAQTEKNRKSIDGLIQKKDRKGNLHWYARIVRTLPSGEKKQYTKKGDNKTHAKRLLRDLENQHFERGDSGIQGERMTFREVALIYEDRHLQPAEYTDGQITSGLKNPVDPKRFLRTIIQYLGNIRLKDLTHSDIERFKVQRLKTPVVRERKAQRKHPETGALSRETPSTTKPRAIASVNRELEQLRAVLRYAVRQGITFQRRSSPYKQGCGTSSRTYFVLRRRKPLACGLRQEARSPEAAFNLRFGYGNAKI
ncbi:MAG: hypothetical protein ABIO36_00970 [Pyrinomonadaceae bacterium]